MKIDKEKNRWTKKLNTQLNALGHAQMHYEFYVYYREELNVNEHQITAEKLIFNGFATNRIATLSFTAYFVPIKEFNWTFIMHYERSEYGY